jgi:hypothetical protein
VNTAPVGSNVATCVDPALPAAPAGPATTNAAAIATRPAKPRAIVRIMCCNPPTVVVESARRGDHPLGTPLNQSAAIVPSVRRTVKILRCDLQHSGSHVPVGASRYCQYKSCLDGCSVRMWPVNADRPMFGSAGAPDAAPRILSRGGGLPKTHSSSRLAGSLSVSGAKGRGAAPRAAATTSRSCHEPRPVRVHAGNDSTKPRNVHRCPGMPQTSTPLCGCQESGPVSRNTKGRAEIIRESCHPNGSRRVTDRRRLHS